MTAIISICTRNPLKLPKNQIHLCSRFCHSFFRFCSEWSQRFNRDNITVSDLNKVVLCLEKIKSKNLGQNPDNLKHFLMKDFNYDCEKTIKLIDEAMVANITKSVIFNGKVAFRTIRAD